jgi:hypothetical protein
MADIRLLITTVVLLLHHTNREGLMSTLSTIQLKASRDFFGRWWSRWNSI